MLGEMLELAMILRSRRFERGALELNLPEVEIDLGDQGEVTGAHLAVTRREPPGHRGIHARGERGRRDQPDRQEIGFLRRAHPDPEPFKLDCSSPNSPRSLGLAIDQPQSRFELQRVLNETAGRPEEYAVHYGLLRSLKQANLYARSPRDTMRWPAQDYCHFTSPIRRYPDLQVHRQLLAWLEGKKPTSRAWTS